MQPIHLAIGIVEGLVTASLVGFVSRTRPEVLETATEPASGKRISIKPVLITLIMIAAFTGGMLSWFASANPDGLEWSIARSSGNKVLQSSESRIHALLSGVQKKIAVFPDYNFRKDKTEESAKSESDTGQRRRLALGKCRDLHFRPSGRGNVACPCRPYWIWDKDLPEKKTE